MIQLTFSVDVLKHLLRHKRAGRKMAYKLWIDVHHEDLTYLNSGFFSL
jgi:hypothetical protein